MTTLTIPPAVDDGALTISIPGAAGRLGIGLSTAKLLVARGELKTIRIGRRRLVLADSLRDYVARLASQ